jgi:hypothetical protein
LKYTCSWSDGLVIRLRNERDPLKVVCMTGWTWFSILDLAEQHGWRPYGAADAEWLWSSPNTPGPREGQDLLTGSYAYTSGSLVLLDDALNLADALDKAFLAYEPERMRSYTDLTLFGVFGPALVGKPGIGVILETAEFCQWGAFRIEQV